MRRLTSEFERDAICAFADHRWSHLPPDEYEQLMLGCSVIYKDDHDTGESWYQVCDAKGWGDGTGAWHPVPPVSLSDFLRSERQVVVRFRVQGTPEVIELSPVDRSQVHCFEADDIEGYVDENMVFTAEKCTVQYLGKPITELTARRDREAFVRIRRECTSRLLKAMDDQGKEGGS